MLNDAYGRPGKERSPKSGRIKRIKLVAGGPGYFRLQIVKVRGSGDDARVKVMRNGPWIRYQGQPESGEDPLESYRVERFKVNVRVKKGEYLAARGNLSSMLRCSSGGDNILEVQPSPRPRRRFRGVTSTDGCWLLLGAITN